MSSACYVYAIVNRGTPLPASDTDAGAGLGLVWCRDIAAVTGQSENGGVAVTMEAVLRHETIVEAVRRQGPALPVRFGTVFRDETSVAHALAQRYEPLAADLEHLGDKVELSLTALWPARAPGGKPDTLPERDAASSARGVGARYLQARAAEFQCDEVLQERARVLARELEDALGSLAVERRVCLLPSPGVAVRTAYLLDPAGVAAFTAAFEVMRRARSEMRVVLTGPWPPYSFVRQREVADGAAPRRGFAELARLLIDVKRGRQG